MCHTSEHVRAQQAHTHAAPTQCPPIPLLCVPTPALAAAPLTATISFPPLCAAQGSFDANLLTATNRALRELLLPMYTFEAMRDEVLHAQFEKLGEPARMYAYTTTTPYNFELQDERRVCALEDDNVGFWHWQVAAVAPSLCPPGLHQPFSPCALADACTSRW